MRAHGQANVVPLSSMEHPALAEPTRCLEQVMSVSVAVGHADSFVSEGVDKARTRTGRKSGAKANGPTAGEMSTVQLKGQHDLGEKEEKASVTRTQSRPVKKKGRAQEDAESSEESGTQEYARRGEIETEPAQSSPSSSRTKSRARASSQAGELKQALEVIVDMQARSIAIQEQLAADAHHDASGADARPARPAGASVVPGVDRADAVPEQLRPGLDAAHSMSEPPSQGSGGNEFPESARCAAWPMPRDLVLQDRGKALVVCQFQGYRDREREWAERIPHRTEISDAVAGTKGVYFTIHLVMHETLQKRSRRKGNNITQPELSRAIAVEMAREKTTASFPTEAEEEPNDTTTRKCLSKKKTRLRLARRGSASRKNNRRTLYGSTT